MSEVVEVSADWLALREDEDARARSRELALAVAARMAPGPVIVHDLGSGTGSMARWLAPLLPGPQTWVLHDWNPGLTERARRGLPPLDRDGRPVAIVAREGALARLASGDLTGASLVTASALLDVLTAEEVTAVVDACIAARCPVLVSLSVTGEVALDPADPLDAALGSSFNGHQRRLAGGRRLLGPDGAALARRLLLEAGWHVRAVPTFWRLGARDPRLMRAWLDGWIDAALEHSPALGAQAAGYRALRAEQVRRGALSAVIVHTDLLAWPR